MLHYTRKGSIGGRGRHSVVVISKREAFWMSVKITGWGDECLRDLRPKDGVPYQTTKSIYAGWGRV